MKKININKKIILIIILILIVSVTIVLVVINPSFNFNKKKIDPEIAQVKILKDIKENGAVSRTDNYRITFTDRLSLNHIPEEIEVYEYIEKRELTEQSVQELTNELGLVIFYNDVNPNQGRVIMATNDELSLTAEVNRNTLRYYDSIESSNSIDPNFNIDEYIQIGNDFINETIENNDIYQYTGYKLFGASGFQLKETINKNNADYINLYYGTYVNGFPLIDKNEELAPNTISLLMDNDRRVVKASFEFAGKSGDRITSVPIKTPETIVRDISSNKMKLIEITPPIDGELMFVLIDNIEIAYKASDDKLIPVLIVSGEVGTTLPERATAKFIMEAIQIDEEN